MSGTSLHAAEADRRLISDGTQGVFDYLTPIPGIQTFKVIPGLKGDIEILHLEAAPQRTGAGRAAVNEFLVWAGQQGLDVVRADSVDGALGFWSKLGFKDTGRKDGQLSTLCRPVPPHQDRATSAPPALPPGWRVECLDGALRVSTPTRKEPITINLADGAAAASAVAILLAQARQEALEAGAAELEGQHTWISNVAASAILRRMAGSAAVARGRVRVDQELAESLACTPHAHERLMEGVAIQRVAAELPEDWQISVDLERHAGSVHLYHDGETVDFNDPCEGLASSIDAAMEHAAMVDRHRPSGPAERTATAG